MPRDWEDISKKFELAFEDTSLDKQGTLDRLNELKIDNNDG